MQLSVTDVTKQLPDGRLLLNRISFHVGPGEFVGILGRSGAGKSLTLRALNGLLQPSSGSIVLEHDGTSTDITRAKGAALRAIRQKIGVVFQGFHLVKPLTALENVLIGRLGSIAPWRSLLQGFSDAEAEAALAVMAEIGIADLALRRTSSLSGGEMQRVALARALFQQPLLLLADEPIGNLDPTNARLVMQLLAEQSQRTPVIGVFHQPELTARFCTRVIGLKGGQLVYDGPPQLNSEQLLELYGEELADLLQPL